MECFCRFTANLPAHHYKRLREVLQTSKLAIVGHRGKNPSLSQHSYCVHTVFHFSQSHLRWERELAIRKTTAVDLTAIPRTIILTSYKQFEVQLRPQIIGKWLLQHAEHFIFYWNAEIKKHRALITNVEVYEFWLYYLTIKWFSVVNAAQKSVKTFLYDSGKPWSLTWWIVGALWLL